jgi:antitoxin ParD1/3/4
MVTMNISLPDEMKAFVERQVATGQYANSSDYIRDLIRRRQEGVDRLRALIEEGDASPDSDYELEALLSEVREQARSRAA